MRAFLRSRANSFRDAFAGLRYILRTQKNAWIHLAITVIVIFLGIFFHLSRMEWLVLVITIGLVWAAEALNTTLEAFVDLVSPDYHPVAKIVKDVAAATVLVAAISAAVVGFLIFLPAILAFFLR